MHIVIYVYGLHMSPSPRALSAPQKLRKKQRCVSSTHFLHRKYEKVWKIAQKRYPNVVGNNGGGAPWGTFGAPVCFLTRTVPPKCSKSDPKVPKLTPKVVPKC